MWKMTNFLQFWDSIWHHPEEEELEKKRISVVVSIMNWWPARITTVNGGSKKIYKMEFQDSKLHFCTVLWNLFQMEFKFWCQLTIHIIEITIQFLVKTRLKAESFSLNGHEKGSPERLPRKAPQKGSSERLPRKGKKGSWKGLFKSPL